MSKTIRVGILAEVHNLDPLRAQDIDSVFVLRQIFESPFAHHEGATDLEPVLFGEPLRREEVNGRQVYRAAVRDDVTFSDGVALRAEDIADSLNRVALVRDQAQVVVEGKEVVFTLERPNARFDLALSHPQCAVVRRDGDRLVGTGPYIMASDCEPTRMHLVRNPRYRGKPTIDEIVFRAFPLDDHGHPTALIDAIEKGEIDLTTVLARDDINRLSGVRKSIRPGISTSILYLNTQSPRLGDKQVRRALARSIDRLEVARVSYANALAFAAPGLMPRSLGAADDDLSYDLAAVHAEIENGLEMPKRLSILLPWAPRPYLPHPDRFFEALKFQFGEVGVSLDAVRTTSSVEFLDKIMNGREDLVLIGWLADTMDPADFLEANLASSRVPCTENIAVANNNGRLVSEEMDQALMRFRAEHTSAALDEVMRILSEEAPLVPLAYGPSTAAVAFRVRNFKATPLSIFPLAELDVD